MNTVSLDVLVRAVAALEAAKDADDTKPLPHHVWQQVMRSHAALSVRVAAIAAQQEVAVLA